MKKFNKYLLYGLSAFFVMWVALFNGFPLVEGDTGSYVGLPIIHQLPIDRTPFYGYFLRYSNMQTSLWYSVFIQCLLTALAIHAFMRHITQNQLPARLKIVVMMLICAFTPLAWVAAFLMPDIFGGILLLLVVLYMQQDRSKAYGMWLLLLIWGTTAIHNSHFLIVLVFAIITLAWGLYTRYKPYIWRSIALIVSSLSFWVVMCGINAADGKGFVYSPSSHVFMITKFAETGILKTYLDDNCGQKNLRTCAYKEQIPAVSWEFLWSPASPLYKTGGWDSNRAEYSTIIHDVFTTPKYTVRFAEKSLLYTFQQFIAVNIPDQFTSHGEGSSPYGNIAVFYPYELNEFKRSKQNTRELSGTTANNWSMLFFVLTSVSVLLLYPKIMTREVKTVYALILLFFLVNAFVTATFSTVIYRFQYRVFWILPATNVILLVNWIYKKYMLTSNMKP